jgi:translation initiation factor IF-3
MFRGREQHRPELGFRLLRRLEEEVADMGFVESQAKQDGRNMSMVLAPHRSAKTAAPRKGEGDAPEAELVSDETVAQS